MKPFDHKKIEKRWNAEWKKKNIYKTVQEKGKKKAYVLDMFPYPSGEGLHVGHPKGYIATDIYSRFKKMSGFNVLHPMGWDAFGLPAENYAIKNKVHPKVAVEKNIKRFKEQLAKIGFNYDWEKEINTTDPSYYKWTQWTFLQMFKKGLAFESFEPINWCPSCQTGLANEDLEDGKCERCGSVVEKKPIRQWVLKITEYADRLLKDLDPLNWSESIKESQRNWIGRSEGAELEFKITGTTESFTEHKKIKVFTTRPDTIFGVTYVVIAPEHHFVDELKSQISNFKEVETFRAEIKTKNDIERTAENKDKKGIELKGIFAINPATAEKIPVWIADYVLAEYGTGCVMAVPAHDERDFHFAKKYNLPIKQVVAPFFVDATPTSTVLLEKPHTEDGILINSEKWNTKDAYNSKKEITKAVGGSWVTNYKLRDWVFSRQRYWGEPIPLVHCEKCGVVAVPEKDLPIMLPNVKSYAPTGTGESPLADISSWVNTTCPQCDEENKKTKYVVFDFDGVIGDTYDANTQASIDIGWAKNKKESEQRMYEYFSSRPHHAKGHGYTAQEIIDIKKTFTQFGNSVKKYGFKNFTEFVKEIKKLKNVKIAIVSSGSKVYVNDAVKKSGIKADAILTVEHEISKEEKLEFLAKKWKQDIKNIYYFTDTNADVYELETILDKKKIIGCAWGFLGYNELLKTLPTNQILKKQTDLTKFWQTTLTSKAKRETNTMPQWAGSCWYYLRFIDPTNSKSLIDLKKEKYWQPVDMYVGGTEHATRHLIYARFWHKFLYDIGIVSTKEPFHTLKNQGLILGADGRKMSKRWGNVVNPDDMIERFGADTLRIYEMFMGPFEQGIAWSTDNMIGSRRFIERIWKLSEKVITQNAKNNFKEDIKLEVLFNQTIKKVSGDIESFAFNTAISSMMILVNEMETKEQISKTYYEILLKICSPFAPYITQELWSLLGNKNLIYQQKWPVFDAKKLELSTVTIAIQINGKVRGTLEIDRKDDQKSIETRVLELDVVKKWLEGKVPRKIIYIQGKLLSIVL